MVPNADCSLSCHGSAAVDCGAYSRINVYSAKIPLSAVAGSGTATASSMVVATTTASSSTIASSSLSPSPQAPSPPSSNAVTLSKGAVAGLSVGSALGAVLICVVVYYLWFQITEERPRLTRLRLVGKTGGEGDAVPGLVECAQGWVSLLYESHCSSRRPRQDGGGDVPAEIGRAHV